MDNGANCYRRFLQGDENGIVEIIRDYKDGLILYLNSLTQNVCIAEELMEEVFLRLLVVKPKFSARYSFRTWLYTIGRNTAIDYLRRNAKSINMTAEEMQSVLTEEESLEQSYIREEEKIVVHRAMNQLNANYRQVLYLMFFEDFSTEQIAAVMKRSKRQIANLSYRAKLSLKSQLDKEGFVYEGL